MGQSGQARRSRSCCSRGSAARRGFWILADEDVLFLVDVDSPVRCAPDLVATLGTDLEDLGSSLILLLRRGNSGSLFINTREPLA